MFGPVCLVLMILPISLLLTLNHNAIQQVEALTGRLGNESGHPCDHVTGDFHTWLTEASSVDVVVVGGGVAGLTAVKKLLSHGVTDVVLLEAQDYLGGRVLTYRQDGVLVEDGAEWIHGGRRNPLYRLARNLRAVSPTLPDDAWDWRFVTQDSEPVDPSAYEFIEALMEECRENGILTDYYNASFGQYFIDRFHEIYDSRIDSETGKALLHYMMQIVNYDEGTGDWLDMSARDADQFVDYGDDRQWENGFDTLITHLKKGIPDSKVHLSSPVCKVYWNMPDESRVLVVTQQGISFLAHHMIVTTSVAHLQERHTHIFHPMLPENFVKTLKAVSLGVANKIQLGWADPWWGPDPLSLHILWTTYDLPQDMSWLYGIASAFSVHNQRAVLQMFVTGDNSTYMESLPETDVEKHILYLLRRVTGENITQPNFFRRTRWGSNPWMLGSYSSFITVAGDRGGVHRHDQLATPLLNSSGKIVVMWAGEHTHNTRYSTVDGAMETGKREALRVISLLKSSKSMHLSH